MERRLTPDDRILLRKLLERAVEFERATRRFYEEQAVRRTGLSSIFRVFAAAKSRNLELLETALRRVDRTEVRLSEESRRALEGYLATVRRVDAWGLISSLEGAVKPETALNVILRGERRALSFYQKLYSLVPRDLKPLIQGILNKQYESLERAREIMLRQSGWLQPANHV